jgi:hypothetical protein
MTRFVRSISSLSRIGPCGSVDGGADGAPGASPARWANTTAGRCHVTKFDSFLHRWIPNLHFAL